MIDKVQIAGLVQDVDHCPSCQEHLVKEIIISSVLDDDIEEALEYACEQLEECSFCQADYKFDSRRI